MTVLAQPACRARGRALVALLAWVTFSHLAFVQAADPAPGAAPPPPTVTIAKPTFKRITEWDEYTGRFVAQQRVDVRARVSGYLESVHFQEGHMVEEGELLNDARIKWLITNPDIDMIFGASRPLVTCSIKKHLDPRMFELSHNYVHFFVSKSTPSRAQFGE